MTGRHEGGCLCGAVRYRTTDMPVRVGACHCRTCQQRTGSAFGIGVYFQDGDVEFLRGRLGTYAFTSDESERWLRNEFCEKCGTTVTWTLEAWPGRRAIAGGTYDDPSWYHIMVHIWTRSAHAWMQYPDDVEVLETSSLAASGQAIGTK